MKFYKDNNALNNYYSNIIDNMLTAIFISDNSLYIQFFKNGNFHNDKNAAYVEKKFAHKDFYLNDMFYGNHNTFTKHSWRKFAKLHLYPSSFIPYLLFLLFYYFYANLYQYL